jgi:hypothetical protein
MALYKSRMERERERLMKELQDALAEIKTLSGLLPICAWCKSVRDDSGYWMRVEQYVEAHSQATFSHSVCPECTSKYFGPEAIATPSLAPGELPPPPGTPPPPPAP